MQKIGLILLIAYVAVTLINQKPGDIRPPDSFENSIYWLGPQRKDLN